MNYQGKFSSGCKRCGATFRSKKHEHPGRFAKRKFCSLTCSARRPSKSRYLKRKGNRLHHRVVMEEVLGRPLLSTEYVHHKNGDKHDNRPENLELVDAKTHGRMHHLIYPIQKRCAVCGNVFIPHKTKRKVKKTCSEPCRRVLQAKTFLTRSSKPTSG